jgi:hypothetical protein
MTYDVFWVLCVQLQGNETSERFILVSADPQLPPESMKVSLPLTESDIREELRTKGLDVEHVESYIQHARTFKTHTTSNEWWASSLGRNRP